MENNIILTSISWLLALSTINDIAIFIWLVFVAFKVWQEYRATRDKLAYAIFLCFVSLSMGRVWMIAIAATFAGVIQTYTIHINDQVGLLAIGMLGTRTLVQVVVIIAILYLQFQWMTNGNHRRQTKSPPH